MRFASMLQAARSVGTAFVQDETGATAIEYGLIAGLIAIAIIVALTAVGGDLSALFNKIATTLTSATGT